MQALPKRLPDYRSYCWLEGRPKGIRSTRNFYRRLDSFCKGNKNNSVQAQNKLDSANWQSKQQKIRTNVRCFPYFFLLGFTKSGTSDLYQSLSKLRHFYPQKLKEPSFWSRRRLGALGSSRCSPKKGMKMMKG